MDENLIEQIKEIANDSDSYLAFYKDNKQIASIHLRDIDKEDLEYLIKQVEHRDEGNNTQSIWLPIDGCSADNYVWINYDEARVGSI